MQKVIAITGASSGIGEATARLLAASGAQLALGARRVERLDQLAKDLPTDTLVHPLDVTSRESVQDFIAKTVERFGRIDVLVNNAGIMPLSPLDADRVEEWEATFQTNVMGVLYGISAVLPHFRKQEAGHLINVSSVAGHLVFPTAAVYCASKFAVRAISEGFRQESGPNLRCTNISPGAIATELAQSVKHAETRATTAAFEAIAIEPGAIARAIRFAIEQPGDVDVNEIIVRPTAQTL